VIETPLTGDIPHDILFNLPEWCVYVETPGLMLFGRELAGYFAYLEYDVADGRKELRFALDYIDADKPILMSQMLHLGPWPLVEAVRKVFEVAEKNLLGFVPETPVEEIYAEFAPLVSLLLYICAVNGEIRGKGDRGPGRPTPVKTKRGPRLFPPQKVTVWDVGVRMGAALRLARETVEKSTSETVREDEGQKRASPRPHVRRAHWHGYWTGPRDRERKFILHWISPVLVSGKTDSDMPVTIRPVKK
jgi:hypothetical protein